VTCAIVGLAIALAGIIKPCEPQTMEVNNTVTCNENCSFFISAELATLVNTKDFKGLAEFPEKGCTDGECAERYCQHVENKPSTYPVENTPSPIAECAKRKKCPVPQTDPPKQCNCCLLTVVEKPVQSQTSASVAIPTAVTRSEVKQTSVTRTVQQIQSVKRAVEVVSQKEVTITRQVEVTVPVVTDVVATRSVVQVVTKPVEVTKQVEVPTVSFTAVNVTTNVTKTKEVPITQVITKNETVQVM